MLTNPTSVTLTVKPETVPHETEAAANAVGLSVVVITRNEAHNLPRLLDSIRELADDIVVFDSGSTDGTPDIARRAGARVFNCKWEGWSATKNRANEIAQGQWILSLDADEAPDADCKAAILEHMRGGLRHTDGAWRVGEINRLTRYGNQWVRHSGWFPDRKIRLWPNGAARWTGAIHETCEFDAAFKVHALDGVVEHHSYPCRADHLAQIEKFGAVWAHDQFKSGQKTPFVLVGLKVAAQWLKTFLLKGGFRDGRTGWTIARLSAWATWRKHHRLRALHQHTQVHPERILIARTDAIGDLVLTLPLVSALRLAFPEATIGLLVRPYAEPVARTARGVDVVVPWTPDAAADPKKSGRRVLAVGNWDAVVLGYPDAPVVKAACASRIPVRIGTARRWHTLGRLTHLNWDGRKDSGGHESWHGLRLLMPFGIEATAEFRGSTYLQAPEPDEKVLAALSALGQQPVLLHPGSHGSAGNWPPERFAALALRLAESGIGVGFTGTRDEGNAFSRWLPHHPNIHPLFGEFDLHQLLALQAAAAAVVASSTGPLHTATALGVGGVGLYGNRAPEWSRRWAPIGPKTTVLETGEYTADGHLDIPLDDVVRALSGFRNSPPPE